MTNIVIPMAGAGSRFADAGYDIPKPLIKVKGMPMVQRAVWGAGLGGRFIYIVQAEHNKKYNLSELLPTFTPNLDVVVVEVDGVTEGAAASILAAKDYINDDELLFICDADGLVSWDPLKFFVEVGEKKQLDGCVAVFTAEGDKWSYLETNEDDLVVDIAEKNAISNKASAGIYYWRDGRDFVKYAEEMIAKDERTNGEFYVAPVFLKAIKNGQRVGVYEVDNFIPLGTPEDLEAYLNTEVI